PHDLALPERCGLKKNFAHLRLFRLRRIREELMPGQMHEYVLESRLAERDRFDLLAECVDQVANQFMPADSFHTNRAVHELAPELEALEDFPLQEFRRLRPDHDYVTADFGLEFARRRDCDQLALMQHPDAIASLRLFHVMRRQHDGHALVLAQMLEVIRKLAARRWIQARAGLVEQQQLRLVEQSLGELDPALQPARQRLDPVAFARRQSEALEHCRNPLAQPPAGDSI